MNVCLYVFWMFVRLDVFGEEKSIYRTRNFIIYFEILRRNTKRY